MADTTTAPPETTRLQRVSDATSRALAARISLGRVLKPVPVEFVLIAGSAILLTIFGVMMVSSATTVSSIQQDDNPYNSGLQHLVFAAVGVPLMLIVSKFSIGVLKKLAWLALIASVALQLLVFTPLGFGSGGNRNWIRVAGMSLQPSEFVKLALCIWLAMILNRKRLLLRDWKHVALPLVPVVMLAVGTVMAGQDLGTVLIMALLVVGAVFFAGVRLRLFILPMLVGFVGVTAAVMSSGSRRTRILSVFANNCLEEIHYKNECFQPMHGLWGLASGGVFGLGLGNSKEKYDWLPAAADDYIFAIVGEELGLIGCLVLLLLYAVFAFAAFRIVARSDDMFARVVSGSIGIWIIGQAFVNIGVVLRLFPALGVPLPFLSAGGSSLIAVLLASGVLLACARTLPELPPPPRR
ncbi:MAG: putative peptidoglycan glycosyltransferase FtsW [Microbacterium sp.]